MIGVVAHTSGEELAAARAHLLRSPRDVGRLELVVRRPAPGQREVRAEGVLDARLGLVGDNWRERGNRHTPDGAAVPEMQVTVMNVRVADLVAGGRDAAPLAGDQLYVDFDLAVDSLPAGTLVAVGSAVLEVTAAPHLGCAKFVTRFGGDAMRFVNSKDGRRHRLRGMNTRVVTPGRIRVGDVVRKLSDDELDGVRLRAMRHDDLPMFAGWLDQPHVRPWWPEPVGEKAIAEYAASI